MLSKTVGYLRFIRFGTVRVSLLTTFGSEFADTLSTPCCQAIDDIPSAVQAATQSCVPDGVLLITGSLYMVGHAREHFREGQSSTS